MCGKSRPSLFEPKKQNKPKQKKMEKKESHPFADPKKKGRKKDSSPKWAAVYGGVAACLIVGIRVYLSTNICLFIQALFCAHFLVYFEHKYFNHKYLVSPKFLEQCTLVLVVQWK